MDTYSNSIRRLISFKEASQADLQLLVSIIYESIMNRAGDVVDKDLARDRAGNLAQVLMLAVDFNKLKEI